MYDLGSRLKEARNKRGITQRDLAAKINKSVSAISGYESNVQTPPTDVLISIAHALNVSITYLVDWESEEYFSTANLDDAQKEFLELLFKEFTVPTGTLYELSSQQIELVRKLLLIFSEK